MDDSNRIPSSPLEALLHLSPTETERLGLTHTPSEIAQQPTTWLETFRKISESRWDLAQFLEKCGLGVSGKALSVSLVGAGTSDYIGRALEALLRKEWKCHVRSVPSTDLLTEMDEFVASFPNNTRHLWISFSRSGDSYEGVNCIRAALEKYPQIGHLVITCNTVGRMANEFAETDSNYLCVTLDDRTNDRGLAMTSSFTNMVIAGQCLAHISELDRYEPIVKALAAAAESSLGELASLAQTIARESYSRICFLGSGPIRAAGDESALKVMELTAGHFSVMSESFLGLRHGPLSWLNSDSLVVAFLSGDEEKSRIELGLLDELKRKNAAKSLLLILPNDSIKTHGDYYAVLNVPEIVRDHYRPPLDVLFAQCLGLFASLRFGLRPDAPSADNKIQRVVSEIA